MYRYIVLLHIMYNVYTTCIYIRMYTRSTSQKSLQRTPEFRSFGYSYICPMLKLLQFLTSEREQTQINLHVLEITCMQLYDSDGTRDSEYSHGMPQHLSICAILALVLVLMQALLRCTIHVCWDGQFLWKRGLLQVTQDRQVSRISCCH